MDHQALFNEIYLHQIYFKQQNHSLFNLFVSILKCLIVKNVKCSISFVQNLGFELLIPNYMQDKIH